MAAVLTAAGKIVKTRWATGVAVVMAAGMLLGNGSMPGGSVRTFAVILPVLPLLYLLCSKLDRPKAVWPLLAGSFALIAVLQLTGGGAAPAVYGAVVLAVAVWALVDGQWRDAGFRLQFLGMLVFGAAAVAGMLLDPVRGRWIVGAAWFLHGLWDFAHLRNRSVVAPAYAEWCGVVDVIVGAALLAGA